MRASLLLCLQLLAQLKKVAQFMGWKILLFSTNHSQITQHHLIKLIVLLFCCMFTMGEIKTLFLFCFVYFFFSDKSALWCFYTVTVPTTVFSHEWLWILAWHLLFYGTFKKKKKRRSLDVSRTCHYSQLHVSRLSLPDCIKLLIEGCVSCLFCWKEGSVCIFFIPQKINW